MFTLDYRDARPIYVQICDGIREQVAAGILQEGDRLPSVRELAMSLTINPNTIQRAYRELEMEGWIASVPGKGNFVRGVPISTEEDRQELWIQLDKLLVQMRRAGIPREEIHRHLTQGGDSDA